MSFSKNEFVIVEMIASSHEGLSAWAITEKLGKEYPSVHRSCSKLIELGIIGFDPIKSEKGGIKKIYRLTSYGFCKFVTESDLFFGSKNFHELNNSLDYPNEQLERLEFFLQQWKHLHAAIDCYNILFLRKRSEGHTLLILSSTLYFTCKEIVDEIEKQLKIIHNLKAWVRVTNGKIITPDGEISASSDIGKKVLDHDPTIKNYTVLTTAKLFFPLLIENFLELSKKGAKISIDETMEIIINSPGVEALKQHIEEKIREYETMKYYYKKYF